MNLAKRVKELRDKKGLTQELLAEESGLSLRTIQRIENNESTPRGDSLKRLAVALNTSPDEIVDWKVQEDQNYLTLMSLSAIAFLFFPLLGIIIPLTLWMNKKDKIKNVNELGVSILNFQITWSLLMFFYSILIFTGLLGSLFAKVIPNWNVNLYLILIPPIIMYLFNIIIIIINTIRIYNNKSFYYKPSLRILR